MKNPQPPAPAEPLSLGYQRPVRAAYGSMGRRPIVWTGVLLLVAFLMPVLVPVDLFSEDTSYELVFPHLDGRELRSPTPYAAFATFYPAMAGLLLLVFAVTTRGVARGVGVLAVALVPLLLTAHNPGVEYQLFLANAEMPARITTIAMLGLGMCGWLGLLVGAWLLRYRPGAKWGRVLVTVGGVLYILAWFVPIVEDQPSWPAVVLVRSMCSGTERMWVRIANGLFLAHGAAMVVAAVGAFIVARRRGSAPITTAIFWIALLAASACAMLVSVARSEALLYFTQHYLTATSLSVLALWSVRGAASVMGLVLPLAVGLADLLIAITPITDQQPEGTRT